MELINKRTYSSKTRNNADGSYTLESYCGHIHYKDANGDFQESDFTIEDKGTYWQMVKHNYHLYIAKDFDAAELIRFDNRYEGRNHSIYFDPKSLRWVNTADPADMTIFRTAQPVAGILSNNTIRWTDAFGTGLHFEVIFLRSGFRKELVIDSLSSLANPPTINHRLTVVSRYRGNGLKVLAKDSVADWNDNNYYESSEGFKIEEAGNRKLRSYIKQAYARDINNSTKQLKLFWKKLGSSLYQIKLLPNKTWFQSAAYPVRADATATYYSGAGDGHVIGWDDMAAWDTVHDVNPATYSDDSGVILQPISRSWSPDFYVTRVFLPFDTSALDDNAVISAADLDVYVLNIYNDDNDAQAYIAIVGPTSQASTSGVVLADAIQCEDVDNPQKLSSDIDIGSFTVSQYNTIALNSTGLSSIDKTGWTKLGLREGHDIEDISIASGYYFNGLNISSSDEIGTSQDPKLTITYTLNPILSIDDSAHTHTADNVTLNQHHNLFINDAAHDHVADNVTLNQHNNLFVNNSAHTQVADNISLNQHHNFIISEASHDHAVDQISISQDAETTLLINDAAHDHVADNVTLNQHNNLFVNNSAHTQVADNISLNQHHNFIISEASHDHAVDQISISQDAETTLLINDSAHDHVADNVTLNQHNNLFVNNSAHPHTADNVTLNQHNNLFVNNSAHPHAGDNIDQQQHHDFIISEASHDHIADQVGLSTGEIALFVNGANHSHVIDLLTFNQHHIVNADGTLHSQIADNASVIDTTNTLGKIADSSISSITAQRTISSNTISRTIHNT